MRIRKSIEELQIAYERGDKKPLEALMRAWKGIQELPPDNFNSFFLIGGYHGEPFRGAGWGNSGFWGGYCNHGNVLFPIWHRVYLYRLENALRSIPGSEEVTLPFWDETSITSKNNGIPWALTIETFELDGETIPNPLRSFKLNRQIKDHIGGDNPDYSKPLGYETVRYPLSGLMGPQEIEKTKAHNALYPNYSYNVGLLNANIINWLTSYIEVGDGVNKRRIPTNVAQKYVDCLKAPNYTVFSNTTSAAEWNGNLPDGNIPVVPLESPHNSIHLAVGGYDVPTGPNSGDFSQVAGANGDMGENDTAAFDPIFYFYHCFVDRVFWLWQKRHGATDQLDIIEHYPGTNSVDSQGPTPGVTPNSWLTLNSPLDPFRKQDGSPYTARDCINIEKQLDYTYGLGSLDDLAASDVALAREPESAAKHVLVSGINRGAIRGSFLISAFATIDGKRVRIGTEAVLSRWHVEGCANCQTHLQASAAIPLRGLTTAAAKSTGISVEVLTRDGLLEQHAMTAAAASPPARPRFRFELL
jgi:tyrosinase